MYLPYTQMKSGPLTLVIRTTADPSGLVGAVKSEVKALDADLPVYDVKTMGQRLSETVAQRRFTMLLLGIFAAAAVKTP